jgi:site-specific DNA-methyltransferase (adenine-specific)
MDVFITTKELYKNFMDNNMIFIDTVCLIKGDCLIESDKIETGSVDLILTDLPYGTVTNIASSDTVKHGMQNKTNWDNIIDTDKIMSIANRILRRNGKMILFAQQPFTTELISKAHKNLPFN